MRLRSVVLGLCLAACSPTGEGDEFAEYVTYKDDTGELTGSSGTAGASDSSSSGGAAPTTGDPTGTGLPDPTTGLPDPTTSDPSLATTSTTTGSDDTTGGPPADCPRVRVTVPVGDVLNVRPDPSTAGEPVGTLAPGAIVDVLAIVQGEVLEGNGEWIEVTNKQLTGFVWSGLVECTLDEPPTDGFFLPLECGMTATVSQGNNGGFSHTGQSAYAFDFSLGSGTPLVAIAAGTVSHMYAGTTPGHPCYDGGGQECINDANFAVVLHGDGTASIYGHLSEVHVDIGDPVGRGEVVGLSGSTGWSTGPHAHVARQEGCGSGWCQSIPVTFADVAGDGVPVTGQSVTSGNCP
jgi:hypothetical protein